jgi:polar amino acid transport system substrate-binding protein
MKLLLIVFFVGFQGFNTIVRADDTLHIDTLIVGYNPTSPFVANENGAFAGPSIWLWEKIATDLDLTYKIVPLPLDSLLSQLESGKIDISASPLTMTSERIALFDFSSPYYIAQSTILVTQESSSEEAWEFLKSFFTFRFFRICAALFAILLLFGFLEWLFERKLNKEEFGTGIKGLWNGFWWSAVTMTTVGYGDKSPKTVGGRIVALIWMFTAIIIISGFTASIASSLTTNKMTSNTSTIEDFKDKQLGTIENSGTDEWLKDNFYINRSRFSTMDEAILALENEQIDGIAYDWPILNEVIKADPSDKFQLIDITFDAQFYAIGMNSKLSTELKKGINLSLLEHTESMDWKVLLTEHDLYID